MAAGTSPQAARSSGARCADHRLESQQHVCRFDFVIPHEKSFFFFTRPGAGVCTRAGFQVSTLKESPVNSQRITRALLAEHRRNSITVKRKFWMPFELCRRTPYDFAKCGRSPPATSERTTRKMGTTFDDQLLSRSYVGRASMNFINQFHANVFLFWCDKLLSSWSAAIADCRLREEHRDFSHGRKRFQACGLGSLRE